MLLSSREKVISVKILKSLIKTINLPNLIIPRTENSIVQAADGQIFVFGGLSYPDKMTLHTIEIIRLGQNEWQLCNLSLPTPLRSLCSISLPEGILLMGGID